MTNEIDRFEQQKNGPENKSLVVQAILFLYKSFFSKQEDLRSKGKTMGKPIEFHKSGSDANRRSNRPVREKIPPERG